MRASRHVALCTCGGRLVRRTWPGHELVINDSVYELDESITLDRCKKCGEFWTSLGDAKPLREFSHRKQPVRVMSREEFVKYWNRWLIKRGSGPLYSE